MSRRSDGDLLRDILEAVRRIRTYTSAMTYDVFAEDTKTQDAVIRNMEIMGEATKGLSAELRETYADVPWQGMAGIRDRLIHRYFGVNLDIVWGVVSLELLPLQTRTEQILKDEPFDK